MAPSSSSSYHQPELLLLIGLTYTLRNTTVPGHVRWRAMEHALGVVCVREDEIRMLAGDFQGSLLRIVLHQHDVPGQLWLNTADR